MNFPKFSENSSLLMNIGVPKRLLMFHRKSKVKISLESVQLNYIYCMQVFVFSDTIREESIWFEPLITCHKWENIFQKKTNIFLHLLLLLLLQVLFWALIKNYSWYFITYYLHVDHYGVTCVVFLLKKGVLLSTSDQENANEMATDSEELFYI